MTEKNDKGRIIYKGPRGGRYVLEKGRKVYKFRLKSTTTPPKTNVNSKGRAIYKGQRGGEYVLDAKGRKVYKFKRVLRGPSPNKVVVPTRAREMLLKLARAMKKRRAALANPIRVGVKTVLRRFTRFSGINPTTRSRPSSNRVVPINVPEGVNTNAVLAVSEDTLPVQKWLDDQSEYIKSLSHEDFYTAMAYTVRSHQWIGPWLRNGSTPYFTFPLGHTFPLYHQLQEIAKNDSSLKNSLDAQDYKNVLKKLPNETIDKAMDMYVKDLQRIVRNAPPLPKTMYVYRGVQTNIFKGKL
jgi:hypothetical protein